MSLKTCKWCLEEKSLQEFNRHPGTLDGYLNKCKICEKEYKAEYYKKNKNGTVRLARIRNKEKYKLAKRTKKYKQIRNESRRLRYKKDINYKITCILRARLKAALKGKSKGLKTTQTIGCSIDFLIKYIESKFKIGMSWSNHGDIWHIDHIKPISKFKLTNNKELRKANHYTNLQPLWKEDNLKKGDRYESCKRI